MLLFITFLVLNGVDVACLNRTELEIFHFVLIGIDSDSFFSLLSEKYLMANPQDLYLCKEEAQVLLSLIFGKFISILPYQGSSFFLTISRNSVSLVYNSLQGVLSIFIQPFNDPIYVLVNSHSLVHKLLLITVSE